QLTLAAERDYWERLFDMAPVALFALEGDTTVTCASAAATELFGADLVGRKLSRLLVEEDVVAFWRHFKKAQENPAAATTACEVRFVSAAGCGFPARLVTLLLPEDGPFPQPPSRHRAELLMALIDLSAHHEREALYWSVFDSTG